MKLSLENKIALDLQQVLLGAISSNVRGVSFENISGKVEVHYLLANDDKSDREEAFDLVAEYEALQSRSVDVNVNVIVSKEVWVNKLKGRLVYARKEN